MRDASGPRRKAPLHSSGDASRLTALLAAGALVVAGAGLLLPGADPYGTAAAAAQTQPAPVNNVLPLLEADKPIFGQFVNYLGVGSDRESAVGHAANQDFDFVVYDLEHTHVRQHRRGRPAPDAGPAARPRTLGWRGCATMGRFRASRRSSVGRAADS